MLKFRSIKFRVTCWYTSIIILVFAIVLAGSFWYSEYYGEDVIKEELMDEVKDLREDILRYSDYFPTSSLTSYYDDGVMLSIYDDSFQMINGVIPDEFPENLIFEDEGLQKVSSAEDNWFVYDREIDLSDGTILWIRGIHSYSSLVSVYQRLTIIMTIFFPILVIFTAFVGYRMIRHSLLPVNTMTKTANDITSSSALSRRIPLPEAKDEFYELGNTFNEMFERLEENFVRERQFSSDAAHELRTPVAVILSHCEYCLDELTLDEKTADEIRLIQTKAQQMSDLVSSLLTISRTERKMMQLEYEEVDLLMLAESVAEELEDKAAEKEITINISSDLSNPVIFADFSMMTRLFMNLIENAICYGKPNGHVEIILAETAEHVILTFKDDGIGISSKDQRHIWERFYQADSSHSSQKGFGLGLFLVKQIVTNHKGTITLTSKPGLGSSFQVKLPKKKPE